MKEEFIEKIYAGWLAKIIGIRLGAPVESWTYEKIRTVYGTVDGYLADYHEFAADDDSNGPLFFLRALEDCKNGYDIKSRDVAEALLNYAPYEHGFFWWGGYGVSTEHTAYLNLRHGISAPRSGSMEQNGATAAEQIGGQIFIDTWGLVTPGNPDLAVKYAKEAASVTHDGNGVYGGMFVAVCISFAFVEADILAIIKKGLSFLPPQCEYVRAVRAVMNFWEKEKNDWRACFAYIHDNFGYDKYPGVCHIIPNIAVMILSLLYGNGDFSRTIQICTMCGWDTDCNAGNVGSIMGVACGLSGLPAKYRDPINDFIVCSGISGYLNNLNVPSYIREVAFMGYHLAGEPVPDDLKNSYRPNETYFDFELPGSTHNIRLSNPFLCKASHSTEVAYRGTGSLCILMDRMVRGDQCRIYYKPFYTREDFSDERYSPVFSPTVYSGQTMSVMLYLDQWNGNETPGVAPYIRTCHDKVLHVEGYVKLVQHQWIQVTYTIPDTDGDVIDEIGLILEGYAPGKFKTLGNVYLDEFTISGKAAYTIDPKKQMKKAAHWPLFVLLELQVSLASAGSS